MKLRFIGTASAKVSINRFSSSVLFSEKDFSLLVDAGDSVCRALFKQGIDVNSIDALIFSHLHSDHYSGFPSLITQMKLEKRSKSLIVYTNIELMETLQKFLFQSYIFLQRLDFPISFISFEDDVPFSVADFLFIHPKQNSHLKKYEKYNPKKQLSFSSSSFLFCYKNNKIHFTADIGEAADLFLFEKEKPTLLIAEYSHIGFEDLIKAAQEPLPHHIIVTHISDEDILHLKNESANLQSDLREKIIFAEDGLVLDFE